MESINQSSTSSAVSTFSSSPFLQSFSFLTYSLHHHFHCSFVLLLSFSFLSFCSIFILNVRIPSFLKGSLAVLCQLLCEHVRLSHLGLLMPYKAGHAIDLSPALTGCTRSYYKVILPSTSQRLCFLSHLNLLIVNTLMFWKHKHNCLTIIYLTKIIPHNL